MDAGPADLQAHVPSICSVWSERYADWDAIEDKPKVNRMIDRLNKIASSLGPAAAAWDVFGSHM